MIKTHKENAVWGVLSWKGGFILFALIPALVCFPFLVAAFLAVNKNERLRRYVVYGASFVVMILALALLVLWLMSGAQAVSFYTDTHLINLLMVVGELFLMGLVIQLSLRHRKYPVILLSVAQTLLLVWLELFGPSVPETTHILLDHFSMYIDIH